MGAAPMAVCKKATPGKGGASWQQQCVGDMDARFGDGNDSDVKHQRSFLDQPPAAGDAFLPEDEEFSGGRAPSP